MLVIAVWFEIHKEPLNALCGQNVEFLDVIPGGTSTNHRALKHRWAKYGPRSNSINTKQRDMKYHEQLCYVCYVYY
jgi:hypothetical protein